MNEEEVKQEIDRYADEISTIFDGIQNLVSEQDGPKKAAAIDPLMDLVAKDEYDKQLLKAKIVGEHLSGLSDLAHRYQLTKRILE